jgi:hypothetical protein
MDRVPQSAAALYTYTYRAEVLPRRKILLGQL